MEHGIRRRQFVFAVALAAIGSSVLPQPSRRMYRIGTLSAGSPGPVEEPYVRAIHDSLREHGYEVGRNLIFENRWARDNYAELPHLAAELVALKPDILLTAGTPAAKALKSATQTIPIVVIVSGDPEANGLVSKLAMPGGNITGSTFFASELAAKRVELLKAALPDMRELAFLMDPASPTAGQTLEATQKAAAILKISVHQVEAHRESEWEHALASLRRKNIQGAIVYEDAVIFDDAKPIAQLALRYGVAAAGSTQLADVGGLLGFDAELLHMYRRTGYFVDRILKGANPGSLPIERATKFQVVLNLKTASALGLKLPQALLQRADRVIQ
jgi:putative ABC transport system substrate-binding protein